MFVASVVSVTHKEQAGPTALMCSGEEKVTVFTPHTLLRCPLQMDRLSTSWLCGSSSLCFLISPRSQPACGGQPILLVPPHRGRHHDCPGSSGNEPLRRAVGRGCLRGGRPGRHAAQVVPVNVRTGWSLWSTAAGYSLFQLLIKTWVQTDMKTNGMDRKRVGDSSGWNYL